MMPSLLAIFLVAACVFVPMFGIALFILKSARRAFAIAAVFALGAVFGLTVAAALAGLIVGHAVSAEVRDALTAIGVSRDAALAGYAEQLEAIWSIYAERRASLVAA